MDDVVMIILFIVIIPITAAIAKWTDVYFRIKTKRKWLKNDYHLVGIVSKDRKAIAYKIFLPEESTIWHKGQIWAVDSARIYRKDKPDDGFVINEKQIKWEEGIPVLYLDEDSFRPLDFDYQNLTHAKPGEAGAILKSWSVNQTAKALGTIKRQEMYLGIIIILGIISAGVSYWNHMMLEDISKQTTSMNVSITDLHNYMIPQRIMNMTPQSAPGG